MKKAKELVNLRTSFLRSEWKDWEGRRLNGEETWKGLEKMHGQREDLGQAGHLALRNVDMECTHPHLAGQWAPSHPRSHMQLAETAV